MTTKTLFVELFNPAKIENVKAITSTHKMAKHGKRSPYKMNPYKTALWVLILSVALGFAFMWVKVFSSLFSPWFE